MKTLKRVALAAALLASASSAHAAMKAYQTSGLWSANAGTANDGTPMCSMSIQDKERAAFIKWQAGSENLFVQVYKSSWNIPIGTTMPMTIQFDRAEPFKGTATSIPGGNGQMIEVSLKNEEGSTTPRSFMEEFASAVKMYFIFPGGNETLWSAPMEGSRIIAGSFAKCVIDYSKYATPKTQPHKGGGGGGATQPHNSTPAEPVAPPPLSGSAKRNDI
jgi:hypothetical protein